MDIHAGPDRNLDISKAIDSARVGDIVLIAGKGHEKTQQIAADIIPFSDEKVATQALMAKMNRV